MSVASTVETPPVIRAHPLAFAAAPARIVVLVALLTAAAAYEAFRLSAILNTDVWWHLRTGLWILQEHAFPRAGLFSRYVERPWIDSSWGFDVIVAAAYRLLGLRAIPLLLMALTVGVAAITFMLARGLSGNFWTAVLLSTAAQYAMVGLLWLPATFSIIFFAIELMSLLESRRSGRLRPLLWLPSLFLFWASVHNQFVLGLLVLVFFALVVFTEDILRRSDASGARPSRLPAVKVAAITGISILITVVNPYSFHVFRDVLSNYSDVGFQYFAEMHAMDFRQPAHYLLLLLVMAAFLALGRRRSRDIFKLGILFLGALIAFRIQRDTWCVVLPAIAVLGDAWSGNQSPHPARTTCTPGLPWENAVTVVAVLVLFAALSGRVPAHAVLMNKVSARFPVKACDFIRQAGLPKPLFNTYEWGGFLTWYMPEYPVSVDGRVSLYGDELLNQYFNVTGGSQPLEADPTFSQARTILLDRHSAVAKALTTLPRLASQYHVAYSDDLATVLVRR